MRDAMTRFKSKVAAVDGGCWLWTGSLCRDGYGTFWTGVADPKGARVVGAHQFSYAALTGDVPDGMELDHLCGVRRCVNPAHLEPVPHAENVARGRLRDAQRARVEAITHCPSGHPYDEANTYHVTSRNGRPGRQCRACRAVHLRNTKAKQRAVRQCL